MKIYVSNIKFTFSEDELKNVFAEFGEVISVKIIKDKRTQRSKGFGFIEMADDNARKAIDELNGKEIAGRQLKVSEAFERIENPEQKDVQNN